jgi:hypothetical protein
MSSLHSIENYNISGEVLLMTETQAMSDLKETMDLLKALPGGEAVAAFLGGGY